MDWLDLLAVQGTLKILLQHHKSKVSIIRCSAFFRVQLSNPYMTTGKTIALTRWTFVSKVMSLLFNKLSRLVITFCIVMTLRIYSTKQFFKISCLVNCKLPWFMDLTFQFPRQYCSLQHQTWLTSPDTSTVRCHFRFILSGVVSNHPLLFPSSILYTFWPWGLSSGVISFCFFLLFMGFLQEGYWSGILHDFISKHFSLISSTNISACLWNTRNHDLMISSKIH